MAIEQPKDWFEKELPEKVKEDPSKVEGFNGVLTFNITGDNGGEWSLDIREKVLHELDQVGLSGAEEKYPSQISGGMKKRTALARELVWEPEIMLFDEPSTGLDPIISHAILNLIDDLHKRLSFTGVIVTHEITKVFEIVNKGAMLHEGVIKAFGPAQEVLASEDPLVRQFMRGEIEGPISYR